VRIVRQATKLEKVY